MSPTLPTGVEFRPMRAADVADALAIIRQHDDDDFEEAKEMFDESLEGQYVLTLENRVAGSTGAHYAEDTKDSYWLSWTYLDPQRQGTGLGAVMLVKMIEELRSWEARKVFVSTSDYVDLDRGQIYRDAMAAYQRLGFEEEVRHPDYYDRNEGQIILGLRLATEPQRGRSPERDQREAALLGFGELPESENAYFLDWEYVDEEEGSTPEEAEELIREAGRRRGRVLFASVPSDGEQVMMLLQRAGFQEEGRLVDFYEDGVDDVHFRYDIM